MCALWHFRLGDRALDPWACGRRTARGQSWSPVLADAEARRRFLFGTWRSGGGGALRQQPLATAGRRAAFGCARTLLDFGIGRARPLFEFARKRWPRSTFAPRFLVRARAALGQRFDPAAPARSYGDCSARADRNRWPRGGCGVCALWHFRLGDRALDPWACGRRTARGQSWSPVLADAEARRRFLFGTLRSAVAELFGNSRSQQLAAGQPSDVLAPCWILELAERDRSLNCSEKVAAFHLCATFPRAREGGASASGFDPAAPARSYGDCSARADRNRWPRGGCGVCALWHFRLGDRALDPWACGRRTARGQSWSPVLADAEARRRFLFGTWRSGGGGALRQQPLATAGRRAAFGCARTLLDFGIGRARPLFESARKRWPRSTFAPRFLVRARAALRPAVSIRRRRRAAMGTVRREPIETAGRGVAVACVRSGISGWAIGLLIRGRAGAERRAANPGRRCWPTPRPAAVFCLGL